MEKHKVTHKSRYPNKYRSSTRSNKDVIAKPQPVKTISIQIETKEEPYLMVYKNVDVLCEELARRIKEEILANSNFIVMDIRPKKDVNHVRLGVRLQSQERSHFPVLRKPYHKSS